jgi:hypothetical protein
MTSQHDRAVSGCAFGRGDALAEADLTDTRRAPVGRRSRAHGCGESCAAAGDRRCGVPAPRWSGCRHPVQRSPGATQTPRWFPLGRRRDAVRRLVRLDGPTQPRRHIEEPRAGVVERGGRPVAERHHLGFRASVAGGWGGESADALDGELDLAKPHAARCELLGRPAQGVVPNLDLHAPGTSSDRPSRRSSPCDRWPYTVRGVVADRDPSSDVGLHHGDPSRGVSPAGAWWARPSPGRGVAPPARRR